MAAKTFPNAWAISVATALIGLVITLATPVTGPALLKAVTEIIVTSAISTDTDAITIDLFEINAFISDPFGVLVQFS